MKVATFTTVKGNVYRVRKFKTHTFTAYRVDSRWVQVSGKNSHRVVAAYERQQLPSVLVTTAETSLHRNGRRSFLIQTTATGDYADVCDYFGELVNVTGAASLANGEGITITSLLA